MLAAGLDAKDVATVLGHAGGLMTLDTSVVRRAQQVGDVGKTVIDYVRART